MKIMKRRTLQSMEINPEFLQAVVPSCCTFYTLNYYYSLETNFIIYIYSFTILNHNIIIIYSFYNYSVQLYSASATVSLYIIMHCIVIIK